MQSLSTTTSTSSSTSTSTTSTTTIEITTSTTTLLVTTTSTSTSTSSSTSTSTSSSSTSSSSTSSTSTSTTTLYCHPSLTTSTTAPDCTCINVIDYMFQKINEYKNINNITFRDAIMDALNSGFLIDSCDFCCPDCDIYFLGSVEPYIKLRETDINFEGCCENIYASAETFLKYREIFPSAVPAAAPLVIGAVQPQQGFNLQIQRCCNTNFTNCINDLTKYFADNQCAYVSGTVSPINNSPFATQLFIDDLIRDMGIIEYGSFFGKTQICRLIQNLAYYSPNKCFLDELKIFLDLGLVVECDGSRVIAGGVEAYLKYAEASGMLPNT